ncbi:MAG: ureidoglycolate lyase [Pseudomonadota bacterium]
MANEIAIEKLTREAFAQFGDVLEIGTVEPIMINRGMCARYSDLALMDLDANGRQGISIFAAKAYELPLQLEMLERHPYGSQAFLPTTPKPFLVIVAEDNAGTPGKPRAFMTAPGQGVNYHRGTWHGVLTPLEEARFFVIDRIGEGANLEEHWFATTYVVK